MKSPCLYFLNPLFDLLLGGYSTQHLVKSTAEMGCLFMPVTAAGDMILFEVSVPDDYRTYYQSCGLDCAEIFRAGKQCNSLDGVPWGWNGEAVERFVKAGARCDNPDVSVVKKVNARCFSFSVNKKTSTGINDAAYFSSKEELLHALKSWKRFPLVIKPGHGNAGYGFIRKTEPRCNDKESSNLDILFSNGGGVVVEPWLNRVVDISSICTIAGDGVVAGIRHYRSIQSSSGSFIADIIDPQDKTIEKWRDQLEKAALIGAGELYNAGYFGPAGFDSFTYINHAGKEQLAVIIEINARHTMGTIAFALYDRLADNQVAMLKTMNRKRYKLPDTYDAFLKVLGHDAFDKDKKRGAVLVTPLRISHGNNSWVQPQRSAIFLIGNRYEQLLELDKRVRNILPG